MAQNVSSFIIISSSTFTMFSDIIIVSDGMIVTAVHKLAISFTKSTAAIAKVNGSSSEISNKSIKSYVKSGDT